MAVFDGRHPDVCVLINHTRADIMTVKHLRYRYAAASVGDSDLGTNRKILDSGLNQLYCPGRTIDVNRLGAILIPHNRQQRPETGCVIVMVMSDKNSSDLANVNTRLCKAACDAVASINDIMRP